MDFRIADSFTESLTKLTNEEQKAVKTTAFDLQLNPANPGMKFHRLDRAKDKRFWSVRVNDDLRLIVHRSEDCLLLCYVDHHDKAYQWAECRKLEVHPKTGAAQLVEIREMVKEVIIPQYVYTEQPRPSKPLLFEHLSDNVLLSYGVPPEWLDDVRNADEDTILELAVHLPAEAGEALLNLAIGSTPDVSTEIPLDANPFNHPDAQRRFRVMNNIEELKRALEYPWEKWTIFLHPIQRKLVEGDYNGPARISGSAGTGKTIVALHRAVHLARTNPEARVLLATFSNALANALNIKLKRLINNEPRIAEQIEVYALDTIGRRLYELNIGSAHIASKEDIQQIIMEVVGELNEQSFSVKFLFTEWEEVVDAWQLKTWEQYRDVKRLGRKTRLPEKSRVRMWSIFEVIFSKLKARDLVTYAEMYNQLSAWYRKKKSWPFDFAIVDEAQDVSVPQLQFLAAMGADRPNSLFFTGDLGQRIFQQPFSWKALGVDIRGRSRTLRVNYRTTHQIRTQADRLLGQEIADVDGYVETRTGTISVFNGPQPTIKILNSKNEEIETVSLWLAERIKESINAHEIGVFVRSADELERACAAVKKAGLLYKILDETVQTTEGYVSISTMHLAKGLEFRVVVVMACDDEVLPLQKRIETVADIVDLEEVYNTERHLLYVACTRARDHLFVTGIDPASEFLDDLKLE